MAKNGTPPPGGGRRVTEAQKFQRLDVTEHLMRGGASRAEILGALSEQFGLSTRAADAYAGRARQRLAVEAKGTRETERATTVSRLDHLSKKAEARSNFAAAVGAEKLKAQVLGLMAAQAVEVRATVQTNPESSPEDEDLTAEAVDEELAAIAEALRAGRAEQHAPQQLNGGPT